MYKAIIRCAECGEILFEMKCSTPSYVAESDFKSKIIEMGREYFSWLFCYNCGNLTTTIDEYTTIEIKWIKPKEKTSSQL